MVLTNDAQTQRCTIMHHAVYPRAALARELHVHGRPRRDVVHESSYDVFTWFRN